MPPDDGLLCSITDSSALVLRVHGQMLQIHWKTGYSRVFTYTIMLQTVGSRCAFLYKASSATKWSCLQTLFSRLESDVSREGSLSHRLSTRSQIHLIRGRTVGQIHGWDLMQMMRMWVAVTRKRLTGRRRLAGYHGTVRETRHLTHD